MALGWTSEGLEAGSRGTVESGACDRECLLAVLHVASAVLYCSARLGSCPLELIGVTHACSCSGGCLHQDGHIGSSSLNSLPRLRQCRCQFLNS